MAGTPPSSRAGVTVFFDSTLAADAASIDTGAGGIPAGASVLEVWIIGRTAVAAVASGILVTVNGDGAGNYDEVYIRTSNATVVGANTLAQTAWAIDMVGASAQAGACGVWRMSFPGYTQTTFHKTGEATYGMGEDTAADIRHVTRSLRWRSTAAMTQLAVAGNGGNLVAGSRLLVLGVG